MLLVTILMSLSLYCNAKILQPPLIDSREKIIFEQWKSYHLKTKSDFYNTDGKKNPYLNQLIESHSPYLQQHADNPINWKPWSKALLNRATRENKLILLSIGYSTCHWCHVMRKKSFSQLAVAEVVNSSFYAIKVDREELPHIDAYYLNILEQVKENAGWPITAVITGDGKPLFIDSYLEKNKLINLLTRINQLWVNNPQFLLSASSKMAALVERENKKKSNITSTIDFDDINRDLIAQLDHQYGGLKGKVKFPSEAMLIYALDQIKRSPQPELETLVKLQLNKMMDGGLYDHVGGGFHRYTIDQKWRVPHFEKMLYNQAQLILIYAQAYDLFNDKRYLEVMENTTISMVRDFYKPESGFVSALDADFLGQEGGYYLWSPEEIESIAKNDVSLKTYTVNHTESLGLLFPWQKEEKIARQTQKIKARFLSIRNNRGNLYFDNKILTAWNALAVKALIISSQKLKNSKFLTLATKQIERLWEKRYDVDTGRLARNSYTNPTNATLHLSDYAFLADAFIDLYDINQQKKWLQRAQALSNQAVKIFQDEQHRFTNVPKRDSTFSLSSASDGELISPWATINQVFFRLQKRTQKKQSKISIGLTSKITQNALIKEISQWPKNHFFAAKVVADELYGEKTELRYFANSKGIIAFNCNKRTNGKCVKLTIDIALKSGWHINSNKPLQDYLVATKIELPSEVKIKYPASKQVKLGFQYRPLSVFEGQFQIILSQSKAVQQRLYLKIPIQACNDKLCLLPESFEFYF